MIIAEGEESSDEDYEGLNTKNAEGSVENSTITKRKKRSNPYDAYDFDGKISVLFALSVMSITPDRQ